MFFQLHLTSTLFFNHCFDKRRFKNFLRWFLKNYGQNQLLFFLEKLKFVGFHSATEAGFSISIEDLKIPTTKSTLLLAAEKNVLEADLQFMCGHLTIIERSQRILEIWNRTSEKFKYQVLQSFQISDFFNPVYLMAFSGARGNISQIRQLVGMRGLMADPQGKIIDFPIRSNFREGLTLTEYLISCSGARKGIVDTALRTAASGYLTRRLVDVAHHVVISQIDCQTKKSLLIEDLYIQQKKVLSIQQRLVGRISAETLIHKGSLICLKNQEISKSLSHTICAIQNKVSIRSPLTCCSPKFICQLCYGWNLAEGQLVSVGEAVGVLAAQSIGEPGTQLTMRTFHTGGVFTGDLMDQTYAPFLGNIDYNFPCSGVLIRTLQGNIAYLIKNFGIFKIHHQRIQQNQIQFNFQSGTLLYVRQGELVFPNQLIAELPFLEKEQLLENEQSLFSPICGEMYFENFLFLEKTKFDITLERTQTVQNLGEFWILIGQFLLQRESSFFQQLDLIDCSTPSTQILLSCPTLISQRQNLSILQTYFQNIKIFIIFFKKCGYLTTNPILIQKKHKETSTLTQLHFRKKLKNSLSTTFQTFLFGLRLKFKYSNFQIQSLAQGLAQKRFHPTTRSFISKKRNFQKSMQFGENEKQNFFCEFHNSFNLYTNVYQYNLSRSGNVDLLLSSLQKIFWREFEKLTMTIQTKYFSLQFQDSSLNSDIKKNIQMRRSRAQQYLPHNYKKQFFFLIHFPKNWIRTTINKKPMIMHWHAIPNQKFLFLISSLLRLRMPFRQNQLQMSSGDGDDQVSMWYMKHSLKLGSSASLRLLLCVEFRPLQISRLLDTKKGTTSFTDFFVRGSFLLFQKKFQSLKYFYESIFQPFLQANVKNFFQSYNDNDEWFFFGTLPERSTGTYIQNWVTKTGQIDTNSLSFNTSYFSATPKTFSLFDNFLPRFFLTAKLNSVKRSFFKLQKQLLLYYFDSYHLFLQKNSFIKNFQCRFLLTLPKKPISSIIEFHSKFESSHFPSSQFESKKLTQENFNMKNFQDLFHNGISFQNFKISSIGKKSFRQNLKFFEQSQSYWIRSLKSQVLPSHFSRFLGKEEKTKSSSSVYIKKFNRTYYLEKSCSEAARVKKYLMFTNKNQDNFYWLHLNSFSLFSRIQVNWTEKELTQNFQISVFDILFKFSTVLKKRTQNLWKKMNSTFIEFPTKRVSRKFYLNKETKLGIKTEQNWIETRLKKIDSNFFKFALFSSQFKLFLISILPISRDHKNLWKKKTFSDQTNHLQLQLTHTKSLKMDFLPQYNTSLKILKKKKHAFETQMFLRSFSTRNKSEIVDTITSSNSEMCITLSDIFALHKKDSVSKKANFSKNFFLHSSLRTFCECLKFRKVSFAKRKKEILLGTFLRGGEQVGNQCFFTGGFFIAQTKNKFLCRKAKNYLLNEKSLLHINHGERISQNQRVCSVFYTQSKTGDIVQGIPKIEQIFEARQKSTLKTLFSKNSLFSQKKIWKYLQSVQKSVVNNIQRIYCGQGISISDKHIEIIVRQMTSNVMILDPGQTGLLCGEIVALQWVERIQISNQLIYEPILMGMTKTCLETSSFLSAASFQETTRILGRAAIQNQMDFLRGLKQNVLLGNLIPIGTGCS
uniref:DNA-directed RNA polymerase n=1 Tax=Pseudocodium devriesii TaxID=453070 RepID=A0A386B0W9_9CHLO|nr:RNA polymerase b-subunit [Pseudocodium devriesii]AYC65346.1 RNA polymerase b-subunit [Pseudocodium devriesii]